MSEVEECEILQVVDEVEFDRPEDNETLNQLCQQALVHVSNKKVTFTK